MKRYGRKHKKTNFIILVLLTIMFSLSLGYSIFSEELNINGTLTGSANFKVYFAEAWIKNSKNEQENTKDSVGKNEAFVSNGTVEINTAQGSNKVTFGVTLEYPGDKYLIGTKIKNESSMAVKLKDFGVSKIENPEDIKFSYIELDEETEILQPGGICEYEFVIEWDSESENTTPEQASLEITLEYEQYTGKTDFEPDYDEGQGSMYALYFDANGGQVSQNSTMITLGKTYGELPTPTRADYTFLGWYTALEDGEQITSESVVDKKGNVTLYAKWNYVGHSMMTIARVEPTCTETGNIAHYKCTSCNRLYSDEEGTTEITDVEIPALGHTITAVASVEATCTESGNMAHYKCTRCNKTFSDSEGRAEITDVTIPALWHTLTHIERVEATCTTAGNVEYYECSRCSKLYSDNEATTEIASAVIPALGHDYNDADWEVTTAALCDVAGVETRVCRRACGDYQTREIPELGHDFETEFTIDEEATCTEAGEKSRHCTRCYARTDITTIPATGHTAGIYTVTTEPACETTGEEKTNCTVCGTELTRSIATLGHDYTSTSSTAYKATDATCTAVPTYYKTCTRCGNPGTTTFSSGNALGHSLTKTARVEATCTTAGNIEYYTCSRCSKKFSDSAGNTEITSTAIAAKGHSYQKTSSASVCRTCSVCGNQITSHDMKSGTCTYKKCNNCDYSTGNSSHNYTGSWYNGASYSYLSNDKHYQKCSRCGSFGNAKDHSHSKYTYTNTGSNHIKHSTCTCGKVISSTTGSHSCSTCGAAYGKSNFSHGGHKCACGITW